MKKLFILFVFIFSGISVIYADPIDGLEEITLNSPSYFPVQSDGNINKSKGSNELTADDFGHRPLSYTNALALDLLLPGAGHFYSGKHIEGFFWLLAKGLGGAAVYFTYMDLRSNDLNDGSQYNFDKTSQEYKDLERNSNRDALHMWFAIFTEAAIYSVSLYRTFGHVQYFNKRFIPHFRITMEDNSLEQERQELGFHKMRLRFSWEFAYSN